MEKEFFIKTMKKIVEKRDEQEKFINSLEQIFPNSSNRIYEIDFFSILVETLTFFLGDILDEWLYYFFFERNCEWFEYTIDDKEYFCDSYSHLYDLIKGVKYEEEE